MNKGLLIDEQAILGSGAFGLVCRGKIFLSNVQVQVAVKTTKPSCPASGLRGLLSEIKIMSHIGNHNFILGIAGAYTAELYSDMPDNDASLPEQGVVEIAHATQMESITWDLEKWACEIMSGMEYLASKHVVHADLTTRNVLLTENKTAKISDFGLSRKLYDYENYVKIQQEPLPWRWMSPESLRQMVFNEKTDVWSFGITLWDIFSLGDIPYPGMSWDVDWVSRLDEEGLRLGKPKFDEKDRYAIMLKCWEADSQSRPTFTTLKTIWDESDDGPGLEIEYMELN